MGGYLIARQRYKRAHAVHNSSRENDVRLFDSPVCLVIYISEGPKHFVFLVFLLVLLVVLLRLIIITICE